MEKKQCEICGEMKPQNEFSKSYKHRCKACVAEATRNERKLYKELEHTCYEALTGGAHISAGARAKTALPMSNNDTLKYMATAFMQGMLSNPALINAQTMKMEDIVVLACNAEAAAKALMRILEKKS